MSSGMHGNARNAVKYKQITIHFEIRRNVAQAIFHRSEYCHSDDAMTSASVVIIRNEANVK